MSGNLEPQQDKKVSSRMSNARDVVAIFLTIILFSGGIGLGFAIIRALWRLAGRI